MNHSPINYLDQQTIFQDNEYNVEIDPDLSLIKGTLKNKFEKTPDHSLIPPGTQIVGGKLLEHNVQMAR